MGFAVVVGGVVIGCEVAVSWSLQPQNLPGVAHVVLEVWLDVEVDVDVDVGVGTKLVEVEG